jgi:hypothetical protein
MLNKGKVRLEYQENQVKKEITMRPGELVKLIFAIMCKKILPKLLIQSLLGNKTD